MKTASSLWYLLVLTNAAVFAQPHSHEHVLHTFERQQLSDVYFSEGASAGDINGDGIFDVVCGPSWYAGPDFVARSEIYPAVPQNRKGYADNFFSWVYDFDKDGHNDVLTVGFPGTPGYVYRNPGAGELDQLWEKVQVLDSVSNESPQFTDIDADGIPELVCTRHGHYGYADFKSQMPFDEWQWTNISDDVAPKPFGHGLGVGDVNNDGLMDIIARDGWFERPKVVRDQANWPFHKVAFAPASSDMFAYDVDGDGDNDIVTSLSAHNYGLAWYESTPGDDGVPAFEQHLIMGNKPEDNPYGVLFTEPHALKLADINGDGLQDIVTGKTYWSHHTQSPMWDSGAVVYWFELHRETNGDGSTVVDFIPRKADGESGIGRGLFVGDINGDKLPDIVTGGMKGAHVLTHIKRDVSHEEYELAQPSKRKAMAEGLSPQEAAAHMTVPPGFKVELAAGEPMVHQPIAMCFDHKGRLWVAEGHTYPIRAPEGEGKDRIVIFEDTTGDGLFDKSETFIEGLNLVSGLEVGFGGVYVGAAPYLMFIPFEPGAPAGDGVERRVSARDGATAEGAEQKESADSAKSAKNAKSVASRRTTPSSGETLAFPKDVPPGATVLLDGFGWHDTHETLNAFIWGPDGWLYGCHGVFTHSKVGKPGTPDDQRQGLNAGVWRYHPVRHEFEVFAHGTSNPWGVDFNDHGQAFISACVIPHLWHMVQGGRYHRQGGRHFNEHTYDDIKTIADHAHYVGNIRDHAWWGHEPKAAGSTAAAGGGHAHAGAMIYRGDNWPNAYRNRMFFNNVHGNRVNMEALEKTENASGYIGHHGDDFLFANDHYYRGINLRYGPDGSVYAIDWYDKNACHRTNPEVWDRSNGRIYRISYGDCKPKNVDLEAMSSLELVPLLFHDNNWYATMARRILQHRGGSREIWKAIDEKLLTLSPGDRSDRDDRMILNAIWGLHVTGGLSQMRTKDIDRGVIDGWMIQLELEDREVDQKTLETWTRIAASEYSSPVYRMYLASALQRLPLSQRWELAEVLSGWAEDADDHNIPLLLWYGIEPLVVEDTAKAMQLALSSKIPLLRKYIVRRASAQNETIGPVVAALHDADPSRQTEFLDEMLTAFEGRIGIPMPEAWNAAYDRLAISDRQEIRDKADQLAILFGDQRVFPRMRTLLANNAEDIKRRRRALDVLVRGQDKASADLLLSDNILGNEQLQAVAVRALTTIGNDDVPGKLLANYQSFAPETRKDVISTLVSRPTWTKSLLQAIGDKAVPSSDLHAYHVRQVMAFKNESLNDLLSKHWGQIGESSADRKQQIAKWTAEFTPDVLKKAHLGNGRRVFTKTCQNCHKLFGTGGDIGPDITGSNRANLDYILQNVLDPSAVVGRNYQVTSLVLTSGQIVSGLLKQETDSALTIQTINDKVVVAKTDIEERTLSNISMMPERQLDALSKNDARDLIAYLASPAQVTMSGPPSPIDRKTGKVPGAIEGESMKVVEKTGGRTRNQNMGGFKGDRWSGTDHLWWTGAKPGQRLGLEFSVEEAGTYRLDFALTKASDYAIVKISIDDQIIDAQLDLYDPQVITTGMLSYPSVTLTKGTHRFNIEIVGANRKAAKSYMVGVDYLRLSPTETESSR